MSGYNPVMSEPEPLNRKCAFAGYGAVALISGEMAIYYFDERFGLACLAVAVYCVYRIIRLARQTGPES